MTSPVDEGLPTFDPFETSTPWPWGEKLEVAAPEPPELHKYHVFERLLLLRNTFAPRDPYWAEIITAEEYIAAAEHYNVDRETAYILRMNELSYGSVIKDGALVRMLLFLKNWDTVDYAPGKNRHSLDTAEPIVVGELHCPIVDGAAATFETTYETGKEIGVEVTAKGVGGGGWSNEQVFATGTKFSIKAPFCKLLCAHLRGHYVIWKNLDDENQRLVLANVTGIHDLFPVNIDDDPRYREDHLCRQPDMFENCYRELNSGYSVEKEQMRWVPRPQSGGQSGPEDFDKWTTKRVYKARWGSELTLAGATVGAGVSITSHFLQEIKVTEMLPYGYDYICRYRSVRELPAEWAGKRRTKASP
jgi:hypothetical protein